MRSQSQHNPSIHVSFLFLKRTNYLNRLISVVLLESDNAFIGQMWIWHHANGYLCVYNWTSLFSGHWSNYINAPTPATHTHTLSVALRRQIQRGVGRGSGPPPPSKKSQQYRVSEQYCPDPLKIHKATKPAFNVGPPSRVKHHLNGVSLVDWFWPSFSAI